MIASARSAKPAWLLPFAATLAAMFALQLSNLGFPPLLPAIQRDFAMTFTQLGLFTALYGLLARLYPPRLDTTTPPPDRRLRRG